MFKVTNALISNSNYFVISILKKLLTLLAHIAPKNFVVVCVMICDLAYIVFFVCLGT